MVANSKSGTSNQARNKPAPRLILRFGGIAIAVGVALTGGIYASQRFAQFLIRDTRFFLPGPADYGLESPSLELHGIQFASRQQVLRLFEPDFGRSLYLFPLAVRRKELLGVRWVHDASIARIWPNRIVVHITERKPAANRLASIPPASTRAGGIDAAFGPVRDGCPCRFCFAVQL